jgi:glycosyltransferase involved in cell wall biosynthesis
MEGAANAASEAIVAGVPILSSRIGGIRGLLGDDYPGFFPVGDTQALARLLARAAADVAFYQQLKSWCMKRASLLTPARERSAWHRLLAEFGNDTRRSS